MTTLDAVARTAIGQGSKKNTMGVTAADLDKARMALALSMFATGLAGYCVRRWATRRLAKR